ncbi:MAG TPA: PRC-barrel domain-containing protein [Noviherbaspirillum sp.]
MLQSFKTLKKCSVIASDGDVGAVRDALFDDERWALRYLVVDAGSLATSHEILLLSPQSISTADWEHHKMHMNLDRASIEKSPHVDAHLPVSRQAEASLLQHYGIPYYWDGPHPGGRRNFSDEQLRTIQQDIAQGSEEDQHLRSYDAVAGYAIAARDKQAGHVVDFLFDEEDWSIQYLVIDPRDLWPGKHVLLPADRIEGVYWSNRSIEVDATRDEIEHSQKYDPDHLPPSPRLQIQARTMPGGTSRSRQPRI